MTSTKPIFEDTVTISRKEYTDLLEYKAICKEVLALHRGDSE